MTMAGSHGSHELFKELSALEGTGTLSAGELADLHSHLQFCWHCREAHSQYRLLARVGMPELAATHSDLQEGTDRDVSGIRTKLFARIRKEKGTSNEPGIFSALRSFFELRTGYTALAGAGIAVCFILAVVAAHRAGSRMPTTSLTDVSAKQIQLLTSENEAVHDRLSVQTGQLAQLQEENSRNLQELAKLRMALRTVTDRANGAAASNTRNAEQVRQLIDQRDLLTAQVHELEQTNQNIRAELVTLRGERDKALFRTVSLQSKIDELTTEIREQQRKVHDDEQYLASDRDIRELMGARQLYIADVYDVDSRSRTRRSFGRIFYTQGKSLIFYAFDLDPGVKNASAYQVWGRKEMAQGAPVRPKSLGILYLDNESNHRWVMRFDDAKQLAEIDAVFVTVEPHGGSPKPTGKPFLYALLRKEANHP